MAKDNETTSIPIHGVAKSQVASPERFSEPFREPPAKKILRTFPGRVGGGLWLSSYVSAQSVNFSYNGCVSWWLNDEERKPLRSGGSAGPIMHR